MDELYLTCPHCHEESYSGISGRGTIAISGQSRSRCKNCREWIAFGTEDLHFADGSRASQEPLT